MSSHPNPVRRRYLFALADGGGTVPPELGIVRRLVERGHDVRVLAEASMADDVRATGAELVVWARGVNRASRRPEDDPYRDWECRNPFALFARVLDRVFVGPAAGYAADVRDAVGDRRPDLVLCSMFAYGAMIGAESAGLPFDVLLPNAYALPAPGMPPFGMGLRPAGGPAGRLRDRVISTLTGRLWARGLAPMNQLRHQFGLEPLSSFFEQFARSRRILTLTAAAFDFPAELPANVRYVGPILDDPGWASAAPWTAPPGNDPLVLVGLSSTFQDQADCLQRIADALGTLPVRAVLTTGPALDPCALRAPANVSVVAAAPHSQVLAEAAVVVTHGGHGTVVRALAWDRPVLVLPHGRDQADNAVRVTTRGAGLSLRRTASPERIARAVRTLLDDGRYRDGAAALGSAIRHEVTTSPLLHELEADPIGGACEQSGLPAVCPLG